MMFSEVCEDNFMGNPFDEVQVLVPHSKSRVRALEVLLDSTLGALVCLGMDNGWVKLFSVEEGTLITSFVADPDNSPVTVLRILNARTLLTATMGKRMCLWDLADDCREIRQLTGHKGSIKVVCPMPGEDHLLCSGGNDVEIFIWDYRSGEIVHRVERHRNDREESLLNILPISVGFYVTSSTSNTLYVYKLGKTTGECLSSLQVHRDNVSAMCIIGTRGKHFASGSQDGLVVIWSIEEAGVPIPLKVMNFYEKWRGTNEADPFMVHSLHPLGECLIGVATGRGFALFNFLTTECLILEPKAHQSGETFALAQMHNGARIISASRNEGVLRVWDVRQRKKTNLGRNEPPKIGELIVGKQRLPGVNALSYQVVKTKKHPRPLMRSTLVGELYGHRGSVEQLRAVSDFCAVSCGADGSVVLWKDGRMERKLRALHALECMELILEEEGFSDSDEDEPHSIRSTGVVELNMLSPLDLAAEDRKSSGSCTNSASGGSDSGNIGAVEEDSCDAGFQWENSK